MKYRVIGYFEDLQDNSKPYEVGDTYPRKGLKVSDERIEELKGNKNLQRKPLIEEINEEVKETEYSEY